MHKQSDPSNVSRRQFLAVAGSVAAASTLAVGSDVESALPSLTPPTAARYLVTIDVTKNPVQYTAINADTNAPVPMPNNSITVNKGDEVKWQAITSGAHPRHRAGIRFTTQSPFTSQEFKWSENHSGGDTTQTPGDYYYCVGIFDHVNHEIYADDPKIIVGGTFTTEDQVKHAEAELREVKEKIESIDAILRNAIQKWQ